MDKVGKEVLGSNVFLMGVDDDNGFEVMVVASEVMSKVEVGSSDVILVVLFSGN